MSQQSTSYRTVEGQGNFRQTTSRVTSSSTGQRVVSTSGNVGNITSENKLEYSNVINQAVLSALPDYQELRRLQNIILELRKNWMDEGNRFNVPATSMESYNKRMLLLEEEVDGLLKRKINVESTDAPGRVLDYSLLMNEKENQLVELEKKINNLEDKLRRASKREGELENQIVRLNGVIKGVNNPSITKAELDRLCISNVMDFQKLNEKYSNLRGQMLSFGSLYRTQVDRLKTQGARFENEGTLESLLRGENIQTTIASGVVTVVEYKEKVVEVPIQDARTKHLIHLLAVQMKKNFQKYPKLREDCDSRLFEFFQQELIDIMEIDELERVVEIVKYVPEVVKVDNIYAYSSEKSRKVEFHLRVLIKALLEELEKIKRKTGLVLEMDEGVIGMINQQIMDVVSVDDILKVFRVVPKIVEVEKIVEKVVEKIVEVPQVVAVEKVVEKIVEVEKIKEIDRNVPVPIEVPIIVPTNQDKLVTCRQTIEKAVEIPTIQDRIIEVIREVPKLEIVDRIVEKIVEVDRVVEVKVPVTHWEQKIREVPLEKEKIVETQKVIEKLVEVPVYIEKIVEVPKIVTEIVQVQKIVEKIVKEVEVVTAKEIDNHIETRNVIVERFVEKPVVIIQREERIVEVPQIIEKIVQVTTTVEKPVEVEVIIEKIIQKDVIKEVIREVQVPFETKIEVPKEIEKIVHIPVIHERVKVVTEIIQKPVIETITRQIPVCVEINNPMIIKEPKTIQVEKIVNHYIEVPKPIKYIEEKIVEVLRHVDRIKEVKVPVEKIIEKMVEVPKVVEVEKIVEKIVVVPRVVEKVVEVPQIVERVVPKIMVEERIKEVQKIVQVPVVQDRIQQVPVQKIVYIEVDNPVVRQVEKLVEVRTVQEKVRTEEIVREKVIEAIREVPHDIPVEKIAYCHVEVPHVVEAKQQIIVPVQIPVPVDRIVQKFIPMETSFERVVEVPAVREKIVAQTIFEPQPYEITKVQQKVVIDTQVKQVEKQIPYIRTEVKEVEKLVEKIVPIREVCTEVMTAKQIVEKVVDRCIVVPKVYEVDKIEQKVQVIEKIVEVEKIIPQLVNVNKYIQNIVEKIVEVPIIMEKVKEVVRENEKVVELRNEYETCKEVERVVEKAVVFEKFKESVRDINHIEKVLQIVDRMVSVPVEIVAHEEKLVEVPFILEKIVEKIVVMPQIVEVLKYVHEITEKETLGVAVGVDVSSHQMRLKVLTKDVKIQLDLLMVELRKMRVNSPHMIEQIALIESFLGQLEQFILFPKIVEVPTIVEKIVEVEKEKIVTLPTQDERSIKMEMSLSLLVEKLILELKRIKHDNPNIVYNLEDDVRLIFFAELDGAGQAMEGDMKNKLASFSSSVNRKFQSLGSWTNDHQLMLNSFLQERFLMANMLKSANYEIDKSKTSSLTFSETLRQSQMQVDGYKAAFAKLRSSLSGSVEFESIILNIMKDLERIDCGQVEAMCVLGDLKITDSRIQSLIREKDAELYKLRDQLTRLTKLKTTYTDQGAFNKTINVLTEENNKLKSEINGLRVDRGSSELISSYKKQIQDLNGRIHELEQEKSNLSAQVLNLENELKVRLSVQNYNSSVDIKKSAVTDIRGSEYSQSQSEFRGSTMTSPVQKYGLSTTGGGTVSPKEDGFGIKMVDSKIEPSGTGAKSPTYGLSESQHSSRSGTRQQTSTYGTGVQQVTSTYQTPASSSVSGRSSAYESSSSVSGSGVQPASTSQYQTGGRTLQASTTQGQTGPTYQASTSLYQSGSSGAPYQAGGESGNFQTAGSVSGTGTGSRAYQSGSTYQPGSYQGQSGTSSSSSTYQQPYQTGYNYQSSTYRSGSGSGVGGGPTGSGSGTGAGNTGNITGTGTGATGTSGQPGSSQYSSSYRYEKK